MAPEDGLFFDRKTYLLKSFEVQVEWNKDYSEDSVLTIQPSIDVENTAHVPLRRRGWILQEQLLAPRALYVYSGASILGMWHT